MPDVAAARAYAKLNLTLEVLGKRDDGYHEIVSVAQSISIHDVIQFHLPPEGDFRISVEMDPPLVDPDEDLAGQAAALLGHATGASMGAYIFIRKRIPVAAGLGGGSADAAAVLRGLNRLWSTHLSVPELSRIGAAIGSDVPFSLRIGAALLRGRGERVTVLPARQPFWLALACPPYDVARKTQTLYQALTPSDWTDGARGGEIAQRVRSGDSLVGVPLINSFDRVAESVYPGFAELRDRLTAAAGAPVHLTGAGPGLFALFETRLAAAAATRRMSDLGVRCFVARSMNLERSATGARASGPSPAS